MDTRQWAEQVGASPSFPQPWGQILPDGYTVVVPWPGNFSFPQPLTQGFMPDAIGAQWDFDVQNLLDQSVGVVATFPHNSHMNTDSNRDAIALMTPTFDTVGDSFCGRYSNNRSGRSIHNFTPQASIYFDTYSGPGFSMEDALNKKFRALIDRENPMLPHGTAISLRFEFEGYAPWTCQVKTRDSRRVPHPIPKEKLAHEVAKKLVSFLKKRQATLDKHSEGATPLNSVRIEDLVLVRLDHVSKSSWQPQFMIV